jgi:hypothetical protein
VHLLAIGLPADVERFRVAAGARVGPIDVRRSTVFTDEMACGESADLEADRATRCGRRFRAAGYRFQGRNDDHALHFQEVSRRFPALALILTYGDPNGDDHGSYLFRCGRQRRWVVPERTRERLIWRQCRRYGIRSREPRTEAEEDALYWAENDAYADMAEVARRHWFGPALEWLRGRHPARRRCVRATRAG